MTVVKKKKPKGTVRTKNGRLLFPDKMKLWGLIQADDYGQWLAAEVKAQTKEEAIFIFNQYWDYSNMTGLLKGFTLTGRAYDKYLRIVELGGLDLEYAMKMEPHEVREVVGLYDYE